jgi:hypothetical protein
MTGFLKLFTSLKFNCLSLYLMLLNLAYISYNSVSCVVSLKLRNFGLCKFGSYLCEKNSYENCIAYSDDGLLLGLCAT